MKSYNQNLVKENKQLQVGTLWFIWFVLCKWAVKLDENCLSVEQVTSSGIPWTTRSPIIEGVVQSFYSIFIWKRGITSDRPEWSLWMDSKEENISVLYIESSHVQQCVTEQWLLNTTLVVPILRWSLVMMRKFLVKWSAFQAECILRVLVHWD